MSKEGVKPLAELSDRSRPITYGIVQPGKPHAGGVPIVRVNNFRGGRLDLTDVLRVNPAIEAAYVRSRPEPNDILISLVGSIGQVTIAPEAIAGWNVARAVGLIPMRDRHHAQWVFYALQSPGAQRYIFQNANTTVQATFNLKDLVTLPIPYPPSTTRNAIIELLGSLDDKIELNRGVNETLDAMVQAIFRDWFVDFGPTRRKIEGVTDPVEIMGGLILDPGQARQIAVLFPAVLCERGIPQGWRKDQLGAHFQLERGLSYKGAYLREEGLPMINLGCFLGGGRFSKERLKYYAGDHKRRHTARAGDLMIANTDVTQNRVVLGSPHIVGEHPGPVLFSHHVYAARPRHHSSQRWTRFFFYHLLRPEFRERAEGFATGTTVLALPKDAIEQLEFARPAEELNDAFTAMIEPLTALQTVRENESEKLALLRDLLLPKLMSGEIRLGTAKAIAEAAE